MIDRSCALLHLSVEAVDRDQLKLEWLTSMGRVDFQINQMLFSFVFLLMLGQGVSCSGKGELNSLKISMEDSRKSLLLF